MTHGRDPDAPVPGEPRIGDVHAVVPGHERRYRDDRRPTRDLLHDLVLAVVAQAEVGLDDRGDEVTQRVGRLDDAQHVVVHVLVVRVERLLRPTLCSRRMSPLTTSRIGATSRWNCTRLRRASNQSRCWRGSSGVSAKRPSLTVVVVVVEAVHGVEVAVDDEVEQARRAGSRRPAPTGRSTAPTGRPAPGPGSPRPCAR